MVCSLILSILYRFESVEKMAEISIENLSRKSRYYKMVEHCIFPFDGLVTRPESKQPARSEMLSQEDVENLIKAS